MKFIRFIFSLVMLSVTCHLSLQAGKKKKNSKNFVLFRQGTLSSYSSHSWDSLPSENDVSQVSKEKKYTQEQRSRLNQELLARFEKLIEQLESLRQQSISLEITVLHELHKPEFVPLKKEFDWLIKFKVVQNEYATLDSSFVEWIDSMFQQLN